MYSSMIAHTHTHTADQWTRSSEPAKHDDLVQCHIKGTCSSFSLNEAIRQQPKKPAQAFVRILNTRSSTATNDTTERFYPSENARKGSFEFDYDRSEQLAHT